MDVLPILPRCKKISQYCAMKSRFLAEAELVRAVRAGGPEGGWVPADDHAHTVDLTLPPNRLAAELAAATLSAHARSPEVCSRYLALAVLGDPVVAAQLITADPSTVVRRTAAKVIARRGTDAQAAAALVRSAESIASHLLKRLGLARRSAPVDAALWSLAPSWGVPVPADAIRTPGDLPACPLPVGVLLLYASSAAVAAWVDAGVLARLSAVDTDRLASAQAGPVARALAKALAAAPGPRAAQAQRRIGTVLGLAIDRARRLSLKVIPRAAAESPDDALALASACLSLAAGDANDMLYVARSMCALLAQRSTALRALHMFAEINASGAYPGKHALVGCALANEERGFSRFVRALPAGVIEDVARGAFGSGPSEPGGPPLAPLIDLRNTGKELLAAMPNSQRRVALWRACGGAPAWRSPVYVDGLSGVAGDFVPSGVLALLPAAERIPEAERAVSAVLPTADAATSAPPAAAAGGSTEQPAGNPVLSVSERARWSYVALLPYEAALAEATRGVRADPRNPDLRTWANAAVVNSLARDTRPVAAGAAALDALTFVASKRNERDPIRYAMLYALAQLPIRVWTTAAVLSPLGAVLGDAVAAVDCSSSTFGAVSEILGVLLAAGHGAWTVETIASLRRSAHCPFSFTLEAWDSTSYRSVLRAGRARAALLTLAETWEPASERESIAEQVEAALGPHFAPTPADRAALAERIVAYPPHLGNAWWLRSTGVAARRKQREDDAADEDGGGATSAQQRAASRAIRWLRKHDPPAFRALVPRLLEASSAWLADETVRAAAMHIAPKAVLRVAEAAVATVAGRLEAYAATTLTARRTRP